jgi:hypothetical protein
MTTTPFRTSFFPYLLLLGMMSMTACNTDGDDDSNPCPEPTITYSTFPGQLNYSMNGSGTHGYYELQYGAPGFSLGSGTVVSVNSTGQIGNMNNGAYDIYVRGNCGGDSWSDWAGPQSFLIEGGSSGNCWVPTGYYVNSYTTQAYIDWYDHTGAGYFQVQYGPTGFTFGSGTTINVPESYTTLSGLASGTIYDYYVRANCGGSEFSAWSSVQSFVTN